MTSKRVGVGVCDADCASVGDGVFELVRVAVCVLDCVVEDVADGHVTSNENDPVASSASIKYEP
jgi:hypothetical protein